MVKKKHITLHVLPSMCHTYLPFLEPAQVYHRNVLDLDSLWKCLSDELESLC